MDVIKVLKAGKWQDKPYQEQFSVSVDEVIKIGDGTVVVDGKATCVSREIADIMVGGNHARKTIASNDPASEDKKVANANPSKADKKAAEKGK